MHITLGNGQSVYCEDTATDGPALVLSHGFLMDHEMFLPQVEALRSEFRVVTWDTRGHGLTPARQAFSYDDVAGDMIHLMDALEIERAVLGGMSQGGLISMRVALRAPDRVAGLALISCQWGTGDPETKALYGAMYEEWHSNGVEKLLEPLTTLMLGAAVDPEPWHAKWRALDPTNLAFPYQAMVSAEDIATELGGIHSPALALYGENDLALPIERAALLAERLPGSGALVVIKGAGHAANLARPDEVNAQIRSFVLSPPCRNESKFTCLPLH